MPKQPDNNEKPKAIVLKCSYCGRKHDIEPPEFVKQLTKEYMDLKLTKANEIDWLKQRVTELEEEILVLTQFDDYNDRNHN